MFNYSWGSFGKIHIATLIFAVVFNLLLFLVLKNKRRKFQIISLFLISFAGIAAIAYNFIDSGSLYESLPLEFWALNALILPLAVLFRKKWICNLSLIWSLGSILALVFNSEMARVKVFTWGFFFYYMPHVLCAGIPLILFGLRLVSLDFKTIKSTLLITLAAYTFTHFVNVAINSAEFVNAAGEIIKVNYMNSVYPTNKFFNFLYIILPSPYWYMFLTLPIIFFFLIWWYLPDMLDYLRTTKGLRSRLRALDEYYKEYEEEYIDEIIKEKYE
jgi:uncharacterized membrane protein YwaF